MIVWVLVYCFYKSTESLPAGHGSERQAAGRIAALMKELNFKPKTVGLIVNRALEGKLDAGTMEEVEKQGLTLLGVVPQDQDVYQYDCDGKPIVRLPKDSPVRSALHDIVQKLGL